MEALKSILKEEGIAQKVFRAMQEYGIPFIIPRRTIVVPGKDYLFVFDEHPIFTGHINLFLILSNCRENHPSIQAWGLEDLCEAIAPEIDRLREENWKILSELKILVQLLGPSPITPEYEGRAQLLEEIFKEGQRKKFKNIQTISSDAIEHEEKRY